MIQVGQCGNQVGNAFFTSLFNELSTSSPAHQASGLNTFFHSTSTSTTSTANSLLIDMEPKVVETLINEDKAFTYNPNYAITDQGGSGNNWALGYNHHGPNQEHLIMDKLDTLLEHLDRLDGLLLIHSLAGGTGSGLGSYLNHALKDHLSSSLINLAILPHSSGEVILQTYNAVLTIAQI